MIAHAGFLYFFTLPYQHSTSYCTTSYCTTRLKVAECDTPVLEVAVAVIANVPVGVPAIGVGVGVGLGTGVGVATGVGVGVGAELCNPLPQPLMARTVNAVNRMAMLTKRTRFFLFLPTSTRPTTPRPLNGSHTNKPCV